jgi:hypothetical protein
MIIPGKKFGRKPAVHTPRTAASLTVMRRIIAALGVPPVVSTDYTAAVIDVVGTDWQMLGNDNYGDCVEADDGHYLMLRTANTGKIIVPTEKQILALYSDETGFNPKDPKTDQGTDETSDCEYMVTTGLMGHRADATGMIDPASLTSLQWAIQLFGGCKLGINCPVSAIEQFDNGEPWQLIADDGGIAGGHDVLLVGYDQAYFYGVTWGKLQMITGSWLLKYADEAHALIFGDWVEANGTTPSHFNLDQLLEDLPQIEEHTGTHSHRWKTKRRHRHEREEDT